MCFRVLKKELTKKQNKLARKLCSVKPAPTNYNENPNEIKLFKSTEEHYLLPFSSWKFLGISKPKQRNNFLLLKNNVFKGELLEETVPAPGKHTIRDQQTVFKKAERKLEKDGSCMLQLSTGFGKTCLGIFIATHFNHKTLILCKSDRIKSQWLDSVAKFTDSSAEIVKRKEIPDADFCIMGPMKCKNFAGDLSCFGTVIVDECHQLCTEVFSECLFRLEPKILIGLSATPDRIDGLGELLPPFFGDNPIVRKEKKDFVVWKLSTHFEPNKEYDYRGKLVWSEVIDSLARNKERQRLLAKVLAKHGEGKTIVLSKRKEELRGISSFLDEEKITNTLFIEKKKNYDTKAKIILSTLGKGGVGLDDPEITGVMLASDCIDARQFEGRARAANCVIYDIVDKHSTLYSHSRGRENWYEQRGATIKSCSLRKFVE